MKYSLFNEIIQEATEEFWKQKRQIIRMLQNSGIIRRHRKIKSATILYHAAYAKAVLVSSYEELAQYMTRKYQVQMYPSAWKKWLDKIAPKLLILAEKQAEAEARVRRDSTRRCHQIQDQTLLYSKWVLAVTSLMELPLEKILEKYKERWQIELFFKRGKSAVKF